MYYKSFQGINFEAGGKQQNLMPLKISRYTVIIKKHNYKSTFTIIIDHTCDGVKPDSLKAE